MVFGGGHLEHRKKFLILLLGGNIFGNFSIKSYLFAPNIHIYSQCYLCHRDKNITSVS